MQLYPILMKDKQTSAAVFETKVTINLESVSKRAIFIF